MVWLARIGVALVGLFSAMMAMMALVLPARVAATLGLVTDAGLGMNTVRADIGAFFLLSFACCVGALFAGKRGWLLAPLALFGFAVLGRILDILLLGPPEGIVQPVVVELVAVALLALGLRKLP